MGACLSCLGLSSSSGSQDERQRLLDDSPYANYSNAYQPIPPPNALSPEEQRIEREALDSITRWASDQIVEIFPHVPHKANGSDGDTNGVNEMEASGFTQRTNDSGESSMQEQTLGQQPHRDILLSMIPGDKSKRGIRIYPASRPVSRAMNKDIGSIRTQGSDSKLNSKGSGIFVKLDVDLP